MSPVPFPPLEPIAEEGGRELKLGRFPNRRYEPRNGGSVAVRSFGALSVDASLRISFGVIPDAQMALVWEAFDAAQGDYKPLVLPEKFFFGIRAELLAKIPSTIEWHFPPGGLSYEQVAPGYTRLDPITFIGQLKEQYRNHGAPVVTTPAPGLGADGAWVASGTCADGIDWEPEPPPPEGAFRYYRLTRIATRSDSSFLTLSEFQFRGLADQILPGIYSTSLPMFGNVSFWNDSNLTGASAAALAAPFDNADINYVQFDAGALINVIGFRQACTESVARQLKTFRFWGTNSFSAISLPTNTANGWTIIQETVTMPDLPAIETLDTATVLLSP